MIELVIFDADGVLFDSGESNTAYYNAIFAAIGDPPMDPAEEHAGIFMAAPQIFALRARNDQAKLDRMRAVARTIDSAPFFALLRPPFELRPFLAALKRRYRLGLATNRSATIPALIGHLGLDGIFDAVASARDAVRPKPAPDIVALCLERAGVAAERAVYVGDSDTDRIAAAAAGTHFIGVGARAGHASRIEALEELPAALDRLFGAAG
ncbi:MAG TPA: HAD family hydrolase [Candidatus Binataceae bacterium]|nr:HAD family hydrolase [Candidatus Binataceae bacterium]HVC44966.1 HAD family hydrolase [Candidatus Binataceae bacterium]